MTYHTVTAFSHSSSQFRSLVFHFISFLVIMNVFVCLYICVGVCVCFFKFLLLQWHYGKIAGNITVCSPTWNLKNWYFIYSFSLCKAFDESLLPVIFGSMTIWSGVQCQTPFFRLLFVYSLLLSILKCVCFLKCLCVSFFLNTFVAIIKSERIRYKVEGVVRTCEKKKNKLMRKKKWKA